MLLFQIQRLQSRQALRVALEDVNNKPRTLLVVTGQGLHSSGEPVLKAGVASMLQELQLKMRPTRDGFFVAQKLSRKSFQKLSAFAFGEERAAARAR